MTARFRRRCRCTVAVANVMQHQVVTPDIGRDFVLVLRVFHGGHGDRLADRHIFQLEKVFQNFDGDTLALVGSIAA